MLITMNSDSAVCGCKHLCVSVCGKSLRAYHLPVKSQQTGNNLILAHFKRVHPNITQLAA